MQQLALIPTARKRSGRWSRAFCWAPSGHSLTSCLVSAQPTEPEPTRMAPPGGPMENIPQVPSLKTHTRATVNWGPELQPFAL